MKKRGARKITPYLFILPMLVVCGIYMFYCLGFVFATGFMDWNTGKTMTFIGFDNYTRLFGDRLFLNALKNTAVYFFFCVFFQIGLGILLAVLVKAKLFGSTLVKSLVFMPYVMATVIIAAIFRIMMDTNLGDFNVALRALGLDALAISWLGDARFAMMSLIIVAVFQFSGFHMVLYIGGLSNIPEEIFESAKMDGAGFFTMFFRIVVPMVSGTIMTSLIFGITGALKTFDQVFLLTNGGPGISTELMSTYLYKQFFDYSKGGYASAIGVVILIIGFTLSAFQIRMYERTKVSQ